MIQCSMLLHLLVISSVLSAAVAQDAAAAKPVGSTQPRQSLRACLEKAGVHTVTGDNTAYEKARRTLSKFSNNYPVAIVYPANTEQVQAAVKCAKAAKVKVLPRCGNHGNEGETVETGAMTLDMQKMSRVLLAKDYNTAWVEGGAQQGKLLAEAIKNTNGTRGFPGGVRPTVGVGGFILGGGFGGFTRFAGLGADNLIAIRGVDANGDKIVADKDNNPELLWASRGAGGGKFVIVTDFHVRLMDVSSGVTNFNYTLPNEQAITAMQFYHKWAPNLPDIITHRAGIRTDRTGKKSFYVGGRYMGSEEDTKKALIASGLHDSGVMHVDNFTYKYSDYFTAVEDSMGFTMPPGPDKFTVMSERKYWEFEYAWSYKFRSLIVKDTIFPRSFFETALQFGQAPGAEVDYQALTGYVSKVPKDATAVGHMRDGHFVIIVRGTKETTDRDLQVTSAAGANMPAHALACPANDEDVMAGNINASQTVQKLAAYVPEVRSYINFKDTDLPNFSPDYLTAYYGDQLPALECVKVKYDPTNLFAMPMDVQPATGAAAQNCPELLKKVGTAAANYSRYLLASGAAKSDPPKFTSTAAAAAAKAPAAASPSTVTEGGQKQPGVAVKAGRRLAWHGRSWFGFRV